MDDPGNGQVEAADLAWQQLHEAVANYFGVEPEGVLGLVIACERIDPEEQRLALSSAWSSATPVWRLESYARELLLQLDQALRGGQSDE
jgi:hypothetical protein